MIITTFYYLVNKGKPTYTNIQVIEIIKDYLDLNEFDLIVEACQMTEDLKSDNYYEIGIERDFQDDGSSYSGRSYLYPAYSKLITENNENSKTNFRR